MFEEEKEIRLHDDKKIRYAAAGVKNLLQYRNQKVYIPTLEIWGSRECNLKCKECINRIPYIRQEKINTDMVVSSIRQLTRIAELNRIVISGGEPFLNEELQKIVCCIDRLTDVTEVYIMTNAAVMPKDSVLSAIAKASKPIKVMINEYPEVSDRKEDLKKELRKRGIFYKIRKSDRGQWNGIGNDIRRPLHFETGRMIYSFCRMRNYAVLCGDVVTKCPRGISGGKMPGINELPVEYFKVSDLKNNYFAKVRLALCLDKNIHKEYCRECFGLSEENPYKDVPGVQIRSNSKQDEK